VGASIVLVINSSFMGGNWVQHFSQKKLSSE